MIDPRQLQQSPASGASAIIWAALRELFLRTLKV